MAVLKLTDQVGGGGAGGRDARARGGAEPRGGMGARRGAERARELFTRGEGEECVRPPAPPKAGGCGSLPLRSPHPGPSELRARGGEGAGGARRSRGAGVRVALVCVVPGPGLGRGMGGSRCFPGS